MAVAEQAGYGEVRLDEIFTLELNGGGDIKNKTLMLNRKAKNKNKNFEMAYLKGLGFGKDSEQWVGNC